MKNALAWMILGSAAGVAFLVQQVLGWAAKEVVANG